MFSNLTARKDNGRSAQIGGRLGPRRVRGLGSCSLRWKQKAKLSSSAPFWAPGSSLTTVLLILELEVIPIKCSVHNYHLPLPQHRNKQSSQKTSRAQVSICYNKKVCSGCHNEVSQTEWLKQAKFIFPRFWRLQVWDQGVCRLGFFLRPLS